MLILEGPDGSGKTTLQGILQEKFQLPAHPRFCTSDGPQDDLARAVFRDARELETQPLSIYDRHPFLSEFAYATAIPERFVRDDFLEGWVTPLLNKVARLSLVILCLPPFEVVNQNVTGCQLCNHPVHTERCTKADITDNSVTVCECEEFQPSRHMNGVAENVAEIYQMYRLLRLFWPEQNNIIVYDYTNPESIKRVFSRCQLHISGWKK